MILARMMQKIIPARPITLVSVLNNLLSLLSVKRILWWADAIKEIVIK
jgi:hypothetical protein